MYGSLLGLLGDWVGGSVEERRPFILHGLEPRSLSCSRVQLPRFPLEAQGAFYS